MVVEHSASFIYNIHMRLQHYLNIDGKWHRSLCDECLTPTQRVDQDRCGVCVKRVKPENFIHNKPHTQEAKDKIRQKKVKSELTYQGIHNWLRREYGVATRCDNGDCVGASTKYNWAKLKGVSYDKDIDCYVQLCASCHIKYDRWGYDISL
jgi:hypothetical protein